MGGLKQWVREQDWVPLYLVTVLLVAFLFVIGAAGQDEPGGPGGDFGWFAYAPGQVPPRGTPSGRPTARPTATAPARPDRGPALLPDGGTRIFGANNMLVAYYGTAGTGALGVLGDAGPDAIVPRLRAAAQAFARGGRRVQPVFELIVTLAHRSPGPNGSYSADIDRAAVQRYIDAAHRNGVLLILDLQPGTAGFLPVAERWAWALRDPWVGLALDPEWRMSRGGVPGTRIGSVDAVEINRVSRWLDALTARERLPQKVFLLHQFRTAMIRHIGQVKPRSHLAEVQHIDGFGPPREKLATYRHVIRPGQFTLGFKLFYRQDVPRMRPGQVLALRPEVRFVSYQ